MAGVADSVVDAISTADVVAVSRSKATDVAAVPRSKAVADRVVVRRPKAAAHRVVVRRPKAAADSAAVERLLAVKRPSTEATGKIALADCASVEIPPVAWESRTYG
jgi:hypothetical protein